MKNFYTRVYYLSNGSQFKLNFNRINLQIKYTGATKFKHAISVLNTIIFIVFQCSCVTQSTNIHDYVISAL